jgi:hypothetical protein
MGNIKMVVTERPVDLDGASLELVKTVSQMIGVLQQAQQAGAATHGESFLVVFFKYKVWIFKVITLGRTFTGCTLQW